jgi:hypothetical protein
LIPLWKLAEPFRDVAAIYTPVESADAYERGELISFLLDDDWGVFSDKVQRQNLAQELAVSILEAGLSGKERYNYPDYSGFFRPRTRRLKTTGMTEPTPFSAATCPRQIGKKQRKLKRGESRTRLSRPPGLRR